MYNFDIRGKSVSIELEPGIYVFTCETSTGKTFLCDALKTFKKLGQPVGGFTYSDIQDGRTLEDYLGDIKPRCLMVDRYDMYVGKCDKIIEKLAQNGCIVLVDLKFKDEFNLDYDIAAIELGEGKVRVY